MSKRTILVIGSNATQLEAQHGDTINHRLRGRCQCLRFKNNCQFASPKTHSAFLNFDRKQSKKT